jgi:SSS family solute:Na+ symporter
MEALDWLIIGLYMLGMIGLSMYLGRGQEDAADYYVGGRDLPWWAVGMSTMATQTSAISFISIPAFVALKPGGGLTWLQYELAVPLAMILVAAVLLPFLRSLRLISVYAYLELRFGGGIRNLVSIVFLLSRALGTGVGLYASAVVLNVALGTPLWLTILIMGAVTVVYDTIGGIKAVVYSDVMQFAILLVGLILCIVFATTIVGGVENVIGAIPPDRWRTIDPGTGFGDGSQTPFWGFLIGGFFLYVSYYGADQSQVQRELSASTLRDTRHSLYLNGFARFPLTLLYVFAGAAIGAVYLAVPEFRETIPEDRLDYLVPEFIVQFLPTGIRALLVASLLAAAMSSLDSALNSLSAVTMQDFVERYGKVPPERVMLLSKLTTVLWGAVVTAFAFVVGGISDTVIESINKIGSAVYGPILAAFLVGVLSRRATAQGILWGVLAGVCFNMYLWLGRPEIFWMWWNVTGLLVAVLGTALVSLFTRAPSTEQVSRYTLSGSGFLRGQKGQLGEYVLLLIYFFAILGIMIFVQQYAST